jgi:hypothetical protein
LGHENKRKSRIESLDHKKSDPETQLYTTVSPEDSKPTYHPVRVGTVQFSLLFFLPLHTSHPCEAQNHYKKVVVGRQGEAQIKGKKMFNHLISFASLSWQKEVKTSAAKSASVWEL